MKMKLMAAAIIFLLISNVYFAVRYYEGLALLKEGLIVGQHQQDRIEVLEAWHDQALKFLVACKDAL